MTVEEMLDAMRTGKPVQLPCKIGDRLYAPYYIKGREGWINEYTCTGIHVTDKVSNWHKDQTTIYIVARTESYGSPRHFDISTFGRTVFFTKEEAKDAINRRMQQCSNA